MIDFEVKRKILIEISECVPDSGAGEDEEGENLLQNFLPMRSYSRLADQKVFLITGGRGAGKTELFRILTSHDGLKHIVSSKDRKRYSWTQTSEFLIGYVATGPNSKVFPIASVCTELLKKEKSEQVAAFWGGLLCAVILRRFSDQAEIDALADEYLGRQLKENLISRTSEISKWWDGVNLEKEKWEVFLDRVDDLLNQCDKCIFITYDELDRVCSNYDDLFAFIRSLLDFWYRHNNRFTNIKAKIFLRSDLYNAKALQFVDASKMGAYRLVLNWDTVSLYRMLIKRLANTGVKELEQYLDEIPDLFLQDIQGELGRIPCDSEEKIRQMIEKMVGKHMGRTPKKGASYTWVPNHAQDANGEIAPRPFLKCFAFAAQDMLQHEQEISGLAGDCVLAPSRLQGALTRVSKDRVEELTREEYKWLQNLIDRLEGKTMLMNEEEFMNFLLPENWPAGERELLPGKTGSEMLEALLVLGIVMKTTDGRINVPEIYLHGFGLKRKGGIKRPK